VVSDGAGALIPVLPNDEHHHPSPCILPSSRPHLLPQAEELEFLAEEEGDSTIMKALQAHYPHRSSSEDESDESKHSTIWEVRRKDRS